MAFEVETCEICERTAPASTHPCRFEKACKCWYGQPCKAGEQAPSVFDGTVPKRAV